MSTYQCVKTTSFYPERTKIWGLCTVRSKNVIIRNFTNIIIYVFKWQLHRQIHQFSFQLSSIIYNVQGKFEFLFEDRDIASKLTSTKLLDSETMTSLSRDILLKLQCCLHPKCTSNVWLDLATAHAHAHAHKYTHARSHTHTHTHTHTLEF